VLPERARGAGRRASYDERVLGDGVRGESKLTKSGNHERDEDAGHYNPRDVAACKPTHS
jgi:hypothetical protein